MILNNKNLRLILTGDDDPRLKKLLTNYEDLQNLSEMRLYPATMPQTQLFGIELNNELIGEIGLKTMRWYNRKAEIHIALIKNKRGQKIGQRALMILIEYVFNTLNFHRLEAEVIDYNDIARKMLIKIGFRQEGILREAKFFKGHYYDIIRFGLLKKEYFPPANKE